MSRNAPYLWAILYTWDQYEHHILGVRSTERAARQLMRRIAEEANSAEAAGWTSDGDCWMNSAGSSDMTMQALAVRFEDGAESQAEAGLALLRAARDNFLSSGALSGSREMKAVERIRSAISSAEGAVRHAGLLTFRRTRQEATNG